MIIFLLKRAYVEYTTMKPTHAQISTSTKLGYDYDILISPHFDPYPSHLPIALAAPARRQVRRKSSSGRIRYCYFDGSVRVKCEEASKWSKDTFSEVHRNKGRLGEKGHRERGIAYVPFIYSTSYLSNQGGSISWFPPFKYTTNLSRTKHGGNPP